MDAILTAVLAVLLLTFVAAAAMAIYIFVHVFKRHRKFQKDFDRRWNNR